MANQLYKDRRNAGLCVQCGAEAARKTQIVNMDQVRFRGELFGQTAERVGYHAYCRKCREKTAKRREATKLKEKGKARARTARRKYNAKLRANGLCVTCRKPNDREGRQTCAACGKKHVEAATRLKDNRHMQGLCVQCGKALDDDDKRSTNRRCLRCR